MAPHAPFAPLPPQVANFFGGMPIGAQKEQLKKDCPNVIVGTPGRIKQVGTAAALDPCGLLPFEGGVVAICAI
jgi:superfamily II DNA/RNA helicase